MSTTTNEVESIDNSTPMSSNSKDPVETLENPDTTTKLATKSLPSPLKNWRHDLISPCARLHYLLTQQIFTDVSFSLPPSPGEEDRRIFHAHKLVLLSASPVFEAMFTGLLQNQDEQVKIEDVGPDAWWVLLEVGKFL